MIALALALAMAAGGPNDHDLPRTMSLDEFTFASVEPEPAAAGDLALLVGVHIGTAGAYDADHPCFVFGIGARMHILPWLGADATIDFQTKQKVEDAASIFQVPWMVAGVFYLPLELPVRPYGLFGFGWTITDVTVPGAGDDTDLNALFFLGFGAELELSNNLFVDANLRFVFAGDPPRSGDFSADWCQFTIGILLKLTN